MKAKWITTLALGLGSISALAVLGMCLLITADILIRAIFNYPIVWVPEIVGYMMVVVIFFGLGEAMLAGSHIRIELLLARIPKRVRDVLEFVTLSISTGVSAFFTWHGVSAVMRSYDYGRRDAFGTLNAPLWIPQSVIPIGLTVLTLVLALLTFQQLLLVINNTKHKSSNESTGRTL